jgi:hypothetical protein
LIGGDPWSRQDAGRTVGRAGDGGIDGVINEDRLGLDVIYVHAKGTAPSVFQKSKSLLVPFRDNGQRKTFSQRPRILQEKQTTMRQ